MQMHHQFPKDNYRTEIIAQQEITATDELNKWLREVAESHPLPKGARWLCCKEGAEEFVYSTEENNADVCPKCGSSIGHYPNCPDGICFVMEK